ncbi:OLC1v1030389C1 [Oldenlandia corymbosa var. corymbosa]|uniref:OLC1v1030389C1 n=1 Tax=Oldenlandia corymbosa var. corymbosa TaxID=529605 RepID=A0AAV1CHJ8_OLDCO|nr:OLC1v1030389C1 [Oldenlandia corymbosa var. corymbosa]
MNSLPEEILKEIMVRLPMKSILRFKVVCKAWHALIKSPYFSDQHLNHQHQYLDNKNNHNMIYITEYGCLREDGKENLASNHDVLIIRQGSKKSNVLCTCRRLTYYDKKSRQLCGGSCNGILCFFDRDGLIWLCNPITHEYFEIPITNNTRIEGEGVNRTVELGFGFDSITKDYKVIRILRSGTGIYKLSTNCWSRVEHKNGDIDFEHVRSINGVGSGVFFHGFLHWLVETRNIIDPADPNRRILSFDLHSEEFGWLDIPDRDLHSEEFGWLNIPDGENQCVDTLAILADSLAFVSRANRASFEVWVMREYGNGESWTKKFVLHTQMGGWRQLTCWNDDELLLLHDDSGDLISYRHLLQNRFTMEPIVTTQIHHPNLVEPYDRTRAVIFQPSLVSIRRKTN